jgi:hypothetical protein
MSFVVSLFGYRPPRRADGVAYTQVRVEEATPADGPDGPWNAIDLQVLPNPDPDPMVPAVRNITTTEALLETGWYRLVFLDPGGNESPSTAVGASGAGIELPPSADAVRSRSRLLQKLYPANPIDPAVESALREDVADSVALVQSLTCRTLDQTVPADLVRVALRAVTLKTESIASGNDVKAATAIAQGRRLRSFTAGPYSESYFAPGELFVKNGVPQLDANPALAEALWALATDDCRDRWLALTTGIQAPAGAVSEFNFNRRQRGGIGAWGAGYGIGPDGF